MTKFTKGEWSQSHRKQLDGMYITQVYDDNGESICDLSWHAVHEDGGVTSTDREANAHLIAASPDMYAMIEDLYQMLDKLNEGFNADCKATELSDKAELLLKKARGEV